MQTIFLLAGANKRFYPFNDSHKAMVSLYGKPILEYVIDSLKIHGLTEYIFVVDGHNTSIKDYFGDGSQFGINIIYSTLDSPDGQGAALLKASEHINGPFLVMNPYHIDNEGLIEEVLQLFQSKHADAVIPAIYEENIQEYGSLDVQDGMIKRIIEKPESGKEPSHLKATFGYVFKQDFLDVLRMQPENHYSYEDAISVYCSQKQVYVYEIPSHHDMLTLKHPWHLFNIRKMLATHKKGYISQSAQVASTAIIDAEVIIDDGAIVCDYACIKGSSYIGKNAFVGNFSLIRDSDIGDGVHVGVYSDIARSIIMHGTHSHGSGFIGDSIIGSKCKLAYGFVTANKRIDGGTIHKYGSDKKTPISEQFGAMIGPETKVGINVSTMPGVIMGPHLNVPPGEQVKKNLE
jgi:NDP-sugar pyrophosphorylase family protein